MNPLHIFYFAAGIAALPASAATISINFTDNDSAESVMSSEHVAGAQGADTRVGNWNNAKASGSSGSASGLVFSDGGASGVSIRWTTNLGEWRLDHAVVTGDDRLWKGYLDAAGGSETEPGAAVVIGGIPFTGQYDVYVYFDGANDGSWRLANYAIVGQAIGAMGEDSENTSWGTGQNTEKVYQMPLAGSGGNAQWPISPNNSEGNYVKLSGVTGAEITLAAWGSTNEGNLRAPINGIQIVGVIPEPTTALLAGFSGLSLLVRRRK